jgi:hypothetical protein
VSGNEISAQIFVELTFAKTINTSGKIIDTTSNITVEMLLTNTNSITDSKSHNA